MKALPVPIAIFVAFVVTVVNVFAAGELSGWRYAELHAANYVENDPSRLINVLNVEYEKTGWQAGGQSDTPILVPANSVLWGDLSSVRLPDEELFPLLVNPQTKIGVYFAQVDVTIPSGRFIRTDLNLCRDMVEWWGFCQQDGSTTVVTPASQAAPATVSGPGYPSERICPAVRSASDPSQAINALNQVFETDGYFYGADFVPGQTIPGGSIFWTNFTGRPWTIETDFVPLNNSGTWGAFYAVHDLVANSNGRYLRVSARC